MKALQQPAGRLVLTAFRLSPAKHRQLKVAAAGRGTSLQKALEDAVDLWLLQSPGAPGGRRGRSVRGILKDVDVFALRRQERKKELDRDARLLQSRA